MNKENLDIANISSGNKATLIKIRRQNSQNLKAVKQESQKGIRLIKQEHKQQIQKLKQHYEGLLKQKQDYIRMLETLAYSDGDQPDKKYQELKQRKVKIASFLNDQTIVMHQTLDLKHLGRNYYNNNRQQSMLINTQNLGLSLSKVNAKRSSSKHCIQPAPKIDYRKII